MQLRKIWKRSKMGIWTALYWFSKYKIKKNPFNESATSYADTGSMSQVFMLYDRNSTFHRMLCKILTTRGKSFQEFRTAWIKELYAPDII